MDIRTLPEASRAWLAEHRTARSAAKVEGSAGFGPVVIAVMMSGLAGFFLLYSFLEYRDGPVAMQVFAWTMAASLLAIAVWALRELWEAQRNPWGVYTVVSAPWLLEVKLNKVTVWPLAHLREVRVERQPTDYGDRGDVRLVFPERSLRIDIGKPEDAEAFAEAVREHQRLTLTPPAPSGVGAAPQQEPLIPPSLVPPAGAK